MEVQISVTNASEMKVMDSRITMRSKQLDGAYPNRAQQVDALRSALQGTMDALGITFAELFTIEKEEEKPTQSVAGEIIPMFPPHGSTGSFKSSGIQPDEMECGRFELDEAQGDFIVVFSRSFPRRNDCVFRVLWARYHPSVTPTRRVIEVDKFRHTIPSDKDYAKNAREAAEAYWNDGDVGPGGAAGKIICYQAAIQITQLERR